MPANAVKEWIAIRFLRRIESSVAYAEFRFSKAGSGPAGNKALKEDY